MKEKLCFLNRNFVILLAFLIFAIIFYYYNFILENEEEPIDYQYLEDLAESLFNNESVEIRLNKLIPDERRILKPYSSNVFLSKTLDILPKFRDTVQCSILFNPQHSNYSSAVEKASKWKYTVSESDFWESIENSSKDICFGIKNKFAFLEKPLSEEESGFQIAYGMLVYKDIRELTYMISTFYQPQNAYCIGIDGNSNFEFQNRMKVFEQCFPNIHIFVGQNVTYGGPEIPIIVLSCLQKLNERRHPWKYYQYLSGVDLPLKTNLEMVRIFKALNGTFNAEVSVKKKSRYQKAGKPPMPLWKSSLSATFSRASANVILTHQKIPGLIQYLLKTGCPDESLWATMAGNPDYIQMPGGFSAAEFYAKIQSDTSDPPKLSPPPKMWPKNSFPILSYYISRYQVWDGINEYGIQNVCAGKWSHDSCIFGVGDLPAIILRPELVAHKLYLDHEPAAFFCLYEKIRERSLDLKNQQNFDASNYEQLPQVQISRGKSINDVKFFF